MALPILRDSFVGRREELERLNAWSEAGGGLLTLLGPGGAGKTRLALQFAHQLAPHRPVAFCDLTTARDKDTLVTAIAQALGQALGQNSPEEAIEALSAGLKGWGSGLVILDNAEHLLEDVAWAVDRLWPAAPELHFLVTSRHLLNLRGEVSIPLGALSPSEAGILIQDRQPGLNLDDDEPALQRICAALDGLPLALEMAAGRTRLLSMDALAERLEGDLGMLQNTQRGTPDRHRTMAAAVEWSISLLEPWELETLAQCAVFRGSFDIPGVEAIVDLGDQAGGAGLISTLDALREHSLLRVDEGPQGPRLRLYEATREVALKALRATGKEAAVRGRHARHYAQLAPQCPSPSLLFQWAGEGAAALEIDNLREVLDVDAHAHPEAAALAALTLTGLIYPEGRLGTWGEALRYLKQVRGLGGVEADTHCRALLYAFSLLIELGEVPAAEEVVGEALSLIQDETLTALAPWAMLRRGILGAHQLKPEEGERAIREAIQGFEALEAVRGSGAVVGLGRSYGALGYVFRRSGQLAPSREALLHSEAYARRGGDKATLSRALGNLAYLDLELGELDSCIASAQQAARLMGELGDGLHQVHAQNICWEALIEAGRLEEAREGLEGSINRRKDQHLEEVDPYPRANLGRLLLLEGDIEGAEAELGASIVAFEAIDNYQSAASYRVWQGFALGMLGRSDAALGLLRSAALVCEEGGDLMGAAYAHLGSGVLHGLRGEGDLARASVSRAVALGAKRESLIAQGVGPVGGAILSMAEVASGEIDGSTRAQRVEEGRGALREAGFPGETVVRGRQRRPIEADAALRVLAGWIDKAWALDDAPSPRALTSSKHNMALELGPGGRWFSLGGASPVKMGRRHAARRILIELADRLREGGAPLGLYDAFDVGWPGQDIDPEAAAHRVYVTISSLRKLGLEEVLLTEEEGYHLDPRVRVSHQT